MIDERALTWTYLLRRDAGYTWLGSSNPFSPAAERMGIIRGGDVLCAWQPARTDLSRTDLDRFRVLILANPRHVSIEAVIKSGFEHVRRFAVLPGFADARWFIPRNSPILAAAALGMCQPYRRLGHLRKALAQLTVLARLPLWYGDELLIAAREPFPLEETLAKPFGGEVIRLAFSTRTPGPARKPTVQILRQDGTVLGYAKLGITESAARLVRREGNILRRLSMVSRGATAAPRLLLEDDVCGMPLLIQEPVEGVRSTLEMTAGKFQFLESLQSDGRRPVAESPFLHDIDKRISALSDPPPILREALDGARSSLGCLNLPSTIVHGDFAPWNICVKGDKVSAFDWDYGHLDGMPLIDELHHTLQVGFLLQGWTAERALDYLRSLHTTNRLSPEQMAAVEIIYLADVLSRRLEEGHSPVDSLNRHYMHLMPELSKLRTAGVAAL